VAGTNRTLVFSNTTSLPAKIYANEGVAQVLCIGGDAAASTRAGPGSRRSRSDRLKAREEKGAEGALLNY
jgi:deoxycytidine triphosphate deaminase